jgi:hypothetical protein
MVDLSMRFVQWRISFGDLGCGDALCPSLVLSAWAIAISSVTALVKWKIGM